MSWNRLDPRIREIAERELSPRQLEVWKLTFAGCGARRISVMLNIHRSTVRTHLDDAHATLLNHGVLRTKDGHDYYLAQEEAA